MTIITVIDTEGKLPLCFGCENFVIEGGVVRYWGGKVWNEYKLHKGDIVVIEQQGFPRRKLVVQELGQVVPL